MPKIIKIELSVLVIILFIIGNNNNNKIINCFMQQHDYKRLSKGQQKVCS